MMIILESGEGCDEMGSLLVTVSSKKISLLIALPSLPFLCSVQYDVFFMGKAAAAAREQEKF